MNSLINLLFECIINISETYILRNLVALNSNTKKYKEKTNMSQHHAGNLITLSFPYLKNC